LLNACIEALKKQVLPLFIKPIFPLFGFIIFITYLYNHYL